MGKSITDCLSGSVQVTIHDSQNQLNNFGAHFLDGLYGFSLLRHVVPTLLTSMASLAQLRLTSKPAGLASWHEEGSLDSNEGQGQFLMAEILLL